MSASKELYRILFRRLCRGMSLVRRGSSSRLELLLFENFSEKQWYDVKAQTHATGKDLNDFYQGVRGNFMPEEQLVLFELEMSEMLAGEHLTIIYSHDQGNTTYKIGLLKLNADKYIVTNDVEDVLTTGQLYSLSAQTKLLRNRKQPLPAIGSVLLLNLHFDTPSVFHRWLDVSILKGYRQKEVADDIVPLYNHIVGMCHKEVSKEDVQTLFDLQSQLGVSTFCSRILFDCLTKEKKTA